MADIVHSSKSETPHQREERIVKEVADAKAVRESELERRRLHRGLTWDELAANPKLTLRDFMCITGADPDAEGEWGIYRLDESGVRLALELHEESIRGREYEEQDAARALKNAPALDFPCSSRELLAFVDGSVAGPDLQVAEGFRRAVEQLPSERNDRISEQIEDLKEHLGADATSGQIMTELAKLAGVTGTCVREVAPDGSIIWIAANGKVNKLTSKALSERLRRQRK